MFMVRSTGQNRGADIRELTGCTMPVQGVLAVTVLAQCVLAVTVQAQGVLAVTVQAQGVLSVTVQVQGVPSVLCRYKVYWLRRSSFLASAHREQPFSNVRVACSVHGSIATLDLTALIHPPKMPFRKALCKDVYSLILR